MGSEPQLSSCFQNNQFNIDRNITNLSSLEDAKRSLRNEALKKRLQLSKVFTDRLSRLICENLVATSHYKKAKSVALFYPIKNEADPLGVFGSCIDSNKKVLFPRIEGEGLVFHKVDSLSDLRLSKHRIYEPDPGLPEMKVEDIELFIIPGLAFDLNGNRLGYGKGYYDRCLAPVTDGIIVGFCFCSQVLRSLPSGLLDKKMDYLASENGVLSCKCQNRREYQ